MTDGQAAGAVDSAIVDVVLPQAFVVIDDLLDWVRPDCPKEIIIRAKKLLPNWAPHSMEQRPMGGKEKRHA